MSTFDEKKSALAIAAVINEKTGSTGVTATATTVVTGTAAVQAGSFGTGDIKIQDISIDATTVLANDSDGALRAAINAKSGTTGVTASLDGSNQLMLTAADGRNIKYHAGGSEETISGIDDDHSIYGSVTLTGSAGADIVIGGSDPGDAGFVAGTSSSSVEVDVLANDSDNALVDAINARTGSTGVTASKDGSNQLVLTAANGQNIKYNVNGADQTITGVANDDFISSAVTLTRYDGDILIGGTDPGDTGLSAGNTPATIGPGLSVGSSDILTQARAETALTDIDTAIDTVATARAAVGASMHQLESAISQTASRYEAGSAALSRILDSDTASETTDLARTQIMSDMAKAMIAQTNVDQSVALSLLQQA